MEHLPQDVCHEICTYLDKKSAPRPFLASISQQWQLAIERQTFRELTIRSHDISDFSNIVTGIRRRFLDKINYIIVLPAYCESQRCQFENDADRLANNDAFVYALGDLFVCLRKWDPVQCGFVALHVKDIYSNSDHEYMRISQSPRLAFDETRQQVQRGSDATLLDLWSFRFHYSFLECLSLDGPEVPVIKSFSRPFRLTRETSDRSMIDIASKFPNLLGLTWVTNDAGIRYIKMRRQSRHALASEIETKLPLLCKLESLDLSIADSIWKPDDAIGSLNMPNTSDQACDNLSAAIRTATTQLPHLRELKVKGVIDSSFFWPHPTSENGRPSWPSLERLVVQFHNRRPCGGTYFWNPNTETTQMPSETSMPLGYDTFEEGIADTSAIDFNPAEHHGWRYAEYGEVDKVVPNDDALAALFQAFGRACLQMPKLLSASLASRIPGDVLYDCRDGCRRQQKVPFGVVWLNAGADTTSKGGRRLGSLFTNNINHRRVCWSLQDWKPNASVQELLEAVGNDRDSRPAVTVFV